MDDRLNPLATLGGGLLFSSGLNGVARPAKPAGIFTGPAKVPATDGYGNPLPVPAEDVEELSPSARRYAGLLANPPQQGVPYGGVDEEGKPIVKIDPKTGKPAHISKLRSVLGTIAEVASPFIGRGALGMLGEKLLYPGAGGYAQQLAHAKAISDLEASAEQRAALAEQRKAMQENQRLARETQLQNQQREQYSTLTGPNSQGYQIPFAPGTGDLSQSLVTPTARRDNMPLPPEIPSLGAGMPALPAADLPEVPASAQPGGTGSGAPAVTPSVPELTELPTQQKRIIPRLQTPQEQIDPVSGKPVAQAGTTQVLTLPGSKVQGNANMLIPNEGTKRELKAAELRSQLQTRQDMERTETIPDNIREQFPDAPKKVTPTELLAWTRAYETATKEKPDLENKDHWIAVIADPKSTREQKAIAQTKLDNWIKTSKATQVAPAVPADLAAEGRNELARALAAGELTSIREVSSLRGAERTAIFALARRINPNFNTAEIQRKIKMQSDFDNGQDSKNMQSFDQFLQHAGSAIDVANDLQRTSSALLNRPLSWIRENAVGNTPQSKQLRRVLVALEPVKKEFESFLLNNRALYESDRKTSDAIINENVPLQDFIAAVQQMAHTAEARVVAANNRYRRVMGHDIEDPFSQEAMDAAKKLGVNLSRWSGEESAAPAAPGAVPAAAKPIVQHSPSTGTYRYSTDGGKTWLPGQPPNQ